MTPVLHQPTAPRVPGSLDGHPAVQYGEPGDRCVCGARLSSYNEYDACRCCLTERGVRARKRQRRRAPASADGEVVTTAAPESRRVSMEVLEMAAEKRQRNGAVREAVRAALGDGEWHGCTELAEHIGCGSGNVTYHLQRMAQSGLLETRPAPRGGGNHYRLRPSLLVHDAPKTAPETSPAQAPDPLPELPTCEAPAPDPAAEAVAEPEPAGGEEWPQTVNTTAANGWFAFAGELQTTGTDSEVEAIGTCVGSLSGLDGPARRRVLHYLACRFVVDGG